VVEEARADHVRGVARGGAAQARVLAQPRQALAGALGVVQAQHRGADDLQVDGRGPEVGVGTALRLRLRGGREQRDEGDQSREERRPANKRGAEQGHGLPVLVASIDWSVRPEAPERSFGNPADSRASPVVLRPVLADGLPFREANLLPISVPSRRS
jgi:hypothetical protein